MEEVESGWVNYNDSVSFRDFDKLGITGKQTVRDLWRQKDIKTLDAGREALSLNVPAHGVLLYKFKPVQ